MSTWYGSADGVKEIMKIRQIQQLDNDLLIQIAELVATVPGVRFTVPDYLNYLGEYHWYLGLFGIFDGSDLVCYLHADRPHPLDKETAYITIAATRGIIPTELLHQLLAQAEEWMSRHGATRWYMETTRRPEGFLRKYHLELLAERKLGRTIC